MDKNLQITSEHDIPWRGKEKMLNFKSNSNLKMRHF